MADALADIDANLHHLFLPQIEALDMTPHPRRCGAVSSLDPDKGHGSAWFAGVGSDCLVTVLDLTVAEATDLTSATAGYLCIGSMSRSSMDTMPRAKMAATPSGLIMYRQEAGIHPYRLRSRTNYASRSLCFTPRFLKQLAYERHAGSEAFLESLADAAEMPAAPQIALMLERLSAADADAPATSFRLTALMAETVGYLIEASESKLAADRAHGSKASTHLVKDAQALMLRRMDSPLTLASIARELCVGRAHLAATYKKETGCGVAEDLRRMRLTRAAALIAGTDRSLTDIARSVGYPRLSSFTEAFKRRYGVAPAQWRAEQR